MVKIKASEVLALPAGTIVGARCADDWDGALDHRAAWSAIRESAKTGQRPSLCLGDRKNRVLVSCRQLWDGERVVVAG